MLEYSNCSERDKFLNNEFHRIYVGCAVNRIPTGPPASSSAESSTGNSQALAPLLGAQFLGYQEEAKKEEITTNTTALAILTKALLARDKSKNDPVDIIKLYDYLNKKKRTVPGGDSYGGIRKNFTASFVKHSGDLKPYYPKYNPVLSNTKIFEFPVTDPLNIESQVMTFLIYRLFKKTIMDSYWKLQKQEFQIILGYRNDIPLIDTEWNKDLIDGTNDIGNHEVAMHNKKPAPAKPRKQTKAGNKNGGQTNSKGGKKKGGGNNNGKQQNNGKPKKPKGGQGVQMKKKNKLKTKK